MFFSIAKVTFMLRSRHQTDVVLQNGRRAAETLLKACERLAGPCHRFQSLLQEPVTQVELSDSDAQPQIVHTRSCR